MDIEFITTILTLITLSITVTFGYGKLNSRVDRLEDDVKDLKRETKEIRSELNTRIDRLEDKANLIESKLSQLMGMMMGQNKGNLSDPNIISEPKTEYSAETPKPEILT